MSPIYSASYNAICGKREEEMQIVQGDLLLLVCGRKVG